ncbi:MAG: aldo/keto reductase [Bacillota bacterium]|jgi:predicted aldo/keto reductase-like oxidoreductase
MDKVILGKTGIKVSPLCFGVLPMGPLQKNLPVSVGAKLIRQALESGVNFLDTAESYRTYPYIREALDGFAGDVVISSKSDAVTYENMEKAVSEALEALGRSYIDIFHLHAARASTAVFEERAGAFKCLKDMKRKGLIRAVGIATHAVDVVKEAAKREDIDVVFPIINQAGLGIIGGSRDEMVKAIFEAYQAGKGLFAMKALAGGHLIGQVREAFDFVRSIPGISAIAIGMVHERELSVNLKLFNQEEITLQEDLKTNTDKKLWVSVFCKGCGTCIDACPNGALSIADGKAVVNHEACLLCGYCNPVCPEFALRVV